MAAAPLPPAPIPSSPPVPWFLTEDEVGRLTREFNWGATEMGPIEDWPLPLLCAVSTCLASQLPITLWLGSEYRFIYNEAYKPSVGVKHPMALGNTGAQSFPEAWDTMIVPRLAHVKRTGSAVRCIDEFFPLLRYDFLEESYWTFSSSPIRSPTGEILGVFSCYENVTERVVSTRRLQTLRDLSAHAVQAANTTDACQLSAEILMRNAYDAPCALMYLASETDNGLPLQLGASVRFPEAALRLISSDPSILLDSINQAFATRERKHIKIADALQTLLPPITYGGYPLYNAREALILPLLSAGSNESPRGVLVLGLHSGRAYDDNYKAFCNLVASQLGSIVMVARERAQQQQRAEELAALDRAKTTFFNNVSHEFRTPLTLILGPLEEMVAECTTNPMKERLSLVHKNVVRLLKLVNSLLDFSRVNAGRMQANYRRVDLARITEDITSMFRAACEKGGLKLAFHCRKPLRDAVYIDIEMWDKIMLNLLSNAFKFTLKGGIEVELADNESGAGVVMSVQDSGCGIPAREMPRLFERFHRIEGSKGRTHEGTGIGLAFVSELVRLHGGTIWAKSVETQGTTFFVSIPYGKAHLPADRVCPDDDGTPRRRSHASIEAVQWSAWDGTEATGIFDQSRDEVLSSVAKQAIDDSRSPSPAGGRPRVLVVDDNADMRRYLCRILAANYSVTSAPDGQAALDKLMEQASSPTGQLPELILSDVMMPRLDGLGLLRAIRSYDSPLALRDIPVLLLSAQAGDEAASGGIEAGADDYLVKPFSAKELVARVSGRLELARHRKAAAAQQQALREEAERANAAKDRFVAVLSHELRTPLTPTLLLAETMAADETLPQVVRADADFIARNTRLEVQLIDDLLDVTKIREHKLVLDKTLLHVHQLLAHTKRLVKSNADAKRIGLEIELKAARDLVVGDGARLQQVFWNLLGNAVKFTPTGGRILVQSSVEADSILVSVTDNGKGIAPDVLPRLFQAFEQGSADVTRSFGGLGLGLSIAKALVIMHGGTLMAYSDGLGKGARFSVSLPLSSASGPAVPTEQPDAPPTPPVQPVCHPNGHAARILLVEDNVATATILQRLLSKQKFDYSTAGSVAEALALARSSSFEVLLCDVGLPDGSGLDVVTQMRTLQPSCKVVTLSGYGTAEDVQRSLKAGASVHLTKPVRTAELTTTIAKLLVP